MPLEFSIEKRIDRMTFARIGHLRDGGTLQDLERPVLARIGFRLFGFG